MNKYLWFVLVSLVVAGCGGDPIVDANKAVEKSAARWQAAQEIPAPEKRVATYRDIIADLRKIPERYPDTPAGQRLAAGGDIGSVSIERFEARAERLAERAACYAKPNVECLLPFTSNLFDKQGSAAVSPRELICSRGLEAAMAALENKRINRRLYADELIQLAFAAAACDKPSRAADAIAAYVDAEPLTLAQRAMKITQVVATPELKPAWPPAIDELERLQAVAGIPADTKASVALTLLSAYSQLHRPEEAVAKLSYVTDELGFRVSDTLQTSGRLIAAGAVDEGLALARGAVSQERFADSSALSSLWTATGYLVDSMGIETNGTLTVASVVRDDRLTSVFTAPEPATAQAVAETLDKITRALDGFDPSLWARDGLRKSQASGSYARIGLLRRKLGDRERAAAAFDKADAASGATTSNSETGLYRFLAAMVDEDLDAMRALALGTEGYSNPYADEFVRAAVADDKIELAIETMATISPQDAGARFYRTLILAMIESGRLERLEEIIDAAPQDSRTKAQHASFAIQAFADAGEPARIESLAARYQPRPSAREQEILTEAMIRAHAAAGNDSEAKALIDTLLTTGLAADANAPRFGNSVFKAQNAATQAFQVGLFDYGLELFGKAERRNAAPLVAAIRAGEPGSAELTQVLMTAHDTVSAAEEATVVGTVVTYLREQTGSIRN